MSEREPRPDERPGAEDEHALAALLERAGPRPPLPEEDLARIGAAARAAWRFGLARRRRRRRLATVTGLAALLALALALGLWTSRGIAPAAVAEIAAFEGRLLASTPTSRMAPATVGGRLLAGSALETSGGASSAALALGGAGTSLRLGGETRVRIASAEEIELTRGALYVDSGERATGGVRVRTPLGTARDVGTQFSVRLIENGARALEIRVRSGAVAVERTGGELVAAPAEELLIHTDGSVERRELAADDPAWGWALAAAPPFAVSGRTLGEVLRWACREAGWRLRYESAELEARAEAIRVRGGVGALRADQVPFAVLPGAGLSGELSSSELLVRRAD